MSDKLRSILRKGDPASGDPGLSPEEVREMRRIVLSAVPEPQRRGWLVPALATAAVLILAAIIALSLWRPEKVEMARGPEPSPSPIPSVRPEKTSPHRPSAGLPTAQEREPEPRPKKKPVRPAPKPEPPPEPEPVVVAHQTQIQFSTPGGTRVIWVLNPATE